KYSGPTWLNSMYRLRSVPGSEKRVSACWSLSGTPPASATVLTPGSARSRPGARRARPRLRLALECDRRVARVAGAAQIVGDDRHAVHGDAGVDGVGAIEAAGQQSGREQEDQRDGDPHGHQRALQPPRAGTVRGRRFAELEPRAAR